METNYKDLTENLVEKCTKHGASEAEVYLHANRQLNIQVLNHEIETIEESSTHGIGFRVIVDGRMGFSHCNDFNDSSFEDTLKRAIAFARLTTPDENNVLPSDTGVTRVTGLYNDEVLGIPMEKKIELALKLEELALSDSRITKSSGSGFGESESEIFITNSKGISKSYKSGGCFLGVSVVAEKGEQKSTGGEYSSARSFSDLKSLEEVASKASREAWEMLDPKMIRTQRAAVIFDRDVARSLFGGVIAALNGERVLQGASFLKDLMGKQFASDKLTIIDDGTREKGMASAPFDGEGVPTQKLVLVEDGVLKSFIYNTQAAKRAGVESTGNASRRGFTSLPGIGTHNLYVENGKATIDEIIASTDRGLLLKGVTGYGINPVNGNFSGGARGFWIENGKIMHPVKGVTIAGKASGMLNQVEMIGNDLDPERTFAAPTIKISEMQIGGA
jgi:PmbA protein